MQTYTLKEMAAGIDLADGYQGVAKASFHNQLRNLHAKGVIKPLSIEKRGPAMLARDLVMFDQVGFAKARIFIKLVQLGIESNILHNIAFLIDDAALSNVIDNPRGKAFLNLALACETSNGDTSVFGGIAATPTEIDKAQIGDRVIQLTVSLPLHTLFKGLFT
jgi:hypothetical protein